MPRARRRDHAPILAEVRKNGYYVLRGFRSRQWCQAAARELDRLIAADPTKLDCSDDGGADHRIWGVERRSSLLGEFHRDAWLQALASEYLRVPSMNYLTLGAKVCAAAGEHDPNGGWHRDSMYERQFKALLYLTDVAPDNAPFQYIQGSNTRRSVVAWAARGSAQNPKLYDGVDVHAYERHRHQSFTGSAGDVLFVDTRGIHRRKPIDVGCRHALTNYYVAVHRQHHFAEYFDHLIAKTS